MQKKITRVDEKNYPPPNKKPSVVSTVKGLFDAQHIPGSMPRTSNATVFLFFSLLAFNDIYAFEKIYLQLKFCAPFTDNYEHKIC